MKKWELQSQFKVESEKFKIDDLIKVLLENRGITSKKDIDQFLNPKIKSITPKNLEISLTELKKARRRLTQAKKRNEQVVVFGDYDVDGITGTAILWENLNKNGFKVMPYIPERIDEGYGLSVKGIDNLILKYPDLKLIVTVDNGIVAKEAVDHANSLGIDVIITDHHIPSGKLPNAYAIIHSVKVCGASVAYVFINELFGISKTYLELVALATVADIMNLTSFNRTLLINGLSQLRKTKRTGLLELIKIAGIDKEKIGVYEIGNVIGPRINAMGRIGSGMDSLRLLCTTDRSRAKELANLLNDTNTKRQQMTFDSTDHARGISGKNKKIIVLADESYNQGIVGLIAGRISEEFYRPSLVIAKEKVISKGSARSIRGVNIIELLRHEKDLFISLGGHPGAAGFSIETKKIPELKKRLEKLAEMKIKDNLLIKKIKIDLKLPINLISFELYEKIYTLSPFGFGNTEPIFEDDNLFIDHLRFVGKEANHLKLELSKNGKKISGILFNHKDIKLNIGDKISAVYNLSLNEWNGNKRLELKLRDIKGN